MIGAVALHREPPDDLSGCDVDADDIGQARAGDRKDLAVGRAEHVVVELVVALADEGPDGEVERQSDRVLLDRGDAFLAIGCHVDALEPLVGHRVDDVGRAVPVVADEHDGLGLGGRGVGAAVGNEPDSHRERSGQGRAKPSVCGACLINARGPHLVMTMDCSAGDRVPSADELGSFGLAHPAPHAVRLLGLQCMLAAALDHGALAAQTPWRSLHDGSAWRRARPPGRRRPPSPCPCRVRRTATRTCPSGVGGAA